MTKLPISIAAILVPSVAAAHPEHSSSVAFGFVHYLTDPFHLAITGVAILLFVAASRFLGRRLSAKRRAL